MSLASFVVGRGVAIIIVWAIALAASYPLFASLESIASATEESLLPKDSESSRAGSIISSISGGGGYDILYISGINISDPSTGLRATLILNNLTSRSSHVVSSVGGYPSLVIQLYYSVENASHTALEGSLNASKYLLQVVDTIRSNLSYTIAAFNNLSLSLSQAEELLSTVDLNYTYGINMAMNLSKDLPRYVEGIKTLDQAYSQAYQQAYLYSRAVSTLSKTLIANETARNDLAKLYLFLWWQAARAIYYYNITGSNYTSYTNLTYIDPRLAPLPQNITLAIYREFQEEYRGGVKPDIAVTDITSRLLLPQVLAPMIPGIDNRSSQIVAEIINRAWLQTYRERGGCFYCTLLPPEGESQPHVTSQLNLLNTLLSLAPEVSNKLRDNGSSYIEDIIYRYILDTGASDTFARGLASAIVSGNISSSLVASLVVGEASKYIANESLPPQYGSYIAQILVTLDPEAVGAIYSNQSLAREAIVILVSGIGGLDPGFSSQVADLLVKSPSRSDVASTLRGYIALAVERLSNGSIGSSDVAYILEKYDPLGYGALKDRDVLINASIDLVILVGEKKGYSQLLGSLPRSVIETIARYPDRAESTAEKYFLSLSLNSISSQSKKLGLGGNATNALLELVSYIVNSYPNQSSDKIRGYIVEIIATSIVEMFGSKYSSDPYIADLIATSSLDVATANTSFDQALLKVSGELFSRAYGQLLGAMRGRLVGSHNDSFIVTYTPTGNDSYASSKLFFSEASNELKKTFPNASVMWTGSVAISRDLSAAASEDVARISRVSEALVFVVLIAVLGSIAAVILPYLGIVIGVVVGGGLAYIVATGGVADMVSLTRTLIYVIPLGLGSDYAAYLVYRYREEYARLRDPRKAAEEALRRAGPAIVASALTVMAGFGSLALGWEFPLFRSIGVFMPLVVAITAASSLTLVPAILSLVGSSRWFLWGFRGLGGGGGASSLALRINRLGLAVLVAFALVSIASLAVYPSIQASHDLRLFLPSNSPSIVSLDAMASDIGYGVVFPTYIAIVKNTSTGVEDLKSIEDLSRSLEKIEGVQSIEGPTRPLGEPINVSQDLLRDPYASRYISGNTTYLRIVISYNPFSQEAVEALKRIREVSYSWGRENGFEVYVGGSTATSEELDRIVNGIFWYRVLPFAVIAMIVIFTIVFGSLPAAVLSVSIVVLSSLISMVLAGMIFNKIFSTAILWFLPQVVFTAMLGVGMDYNSFYMARARELCVSGGKCGSEGAALATGAVGKLIVGLALVVAAAFGSLMLSSSIGLREIGLSLLASAMLISFAASYLIAPPLLSMLGRRAWRRTI